MSCSCKENGSNIHHENNDYIQSYEERYNEKQEEKWSIEKILYIVSLVIFALTFVSSIPGYIKNIMYAMSILLAGYEIIIEGIKNIFKLNFEEDTLMTIAVIAAYILGEYNEACLVILLFKLGEFIEERAVNNSNKNLQKIADIKAKNANLIEGDGSKVVDVNELKVGDKILIKPGEMIPVDCEVYSGSSNIDTSNITGESTPVYVEKDTELLSGAINLDGSLKCIVTKSFEDSTASKIVDLVYEAQNNKGKTEEFITKFAKIYTPIVIVLAVLIVIVPILIGLDIKTWVMRALVFLVASCPCSIVISVPLALYACLGSISKKGMLIKGTKHIEDLSKTEIIAFDKTGTLTTGKMEIGELQTFNGYTQAEVLAYMYSLEKNSLHPIAKSIEKKVQELDAQNNDASYEVVEYKEIAGCGICGKINEKTILFGNKKLLEEYGVKSNTEIKCDINGKCNVGVNLQDDMNYLVVDGSIAGAVSFEEELREGIDLLISDLEKVGVKKAVILTGDNAKNAEKIAKKLNINDVYARLLPNDKLEKVKELKKQGKTVFVGDGINDSPVLAASDFSISMGDAAEIANDTADGILISNKLNSIVDIIKTSKKTIRKLKQNIAFSLIVKVIVLIAGLMGFAPVWLAVFADVGVTVLTVLNSIAIK